MDTIWNLTTRIEKVIIVAIIIILALAAPVYMLSRLARNVDSAIQSKPSISVDHNGKRITIDIDRFAADYLLCLGPAHCKLIQDWK